jgi:hypothetical protein
MYTKIDLFTVRHKTLIYKLKATYPISKYRNTYNIYIAGILIAEKFCHIKDITVNVTTANTQIKPLMTCFFI